MANFMDKVNVPIGIQDNTKLDLGHQHICTNTWFGLNVDYIKEMVPGESIDVSLENFTRLNAMPCPTFGRAAVKRFCAFIPTRTVWRQWTDFLVDTVHIGSDGSNTGVWSDEVPTVTNQNLVDTFINASYTFLSGSANTATNDANFVNTVYLLEDITAQVNLTGTTAYDIKYWDGTQYNYYNFTKTGRRAIALLEQLGYKIYWSSAYTAKYSALPLMAVAKAWCDWMFPNQYVSISGYNTLMALLNRDNGANYALTVADITAILEYCTTTFYDQDFFTAAWDAPNSPKSDLHSDFKIVNIDTVGSILGRNLGNATNYSASTVNGSVTNYTGNATINNPIGGADAPFINPYVSKAVNGTATLGTFATPISEYLLHSLHALSDFLKRNQIAGGRNLDRYLLRYGKALQSEKLNRSLYIARDSQPIQIGDVMSTSDTMDMNKGEGNVLGAYAGKGLSAGRSHYSHSTDEFGYFIIFSTIVPSVGYPQGVDPIVQRTKKTEFYQPEFDSLGSEPIRKETLWVPQYADNGVVNNTNSLYDGIYGFAPRYSTYKVAFDKLTSNFRLCSINGTTPENPKEFNAADSWHLMRMFDYNSFGRDVSRIVHNPNFLRASEDNMQYDRIFYDGNDVRQPDNFTTIINFEIADHFPGKSLYDTYEFEQEGRMVKADVGGVRVN